MNYELAKKLKDAGFPQKEDYNVRSNPYLFPEEFWGIRATGGCYAPTLSELIEACGEGFSALATGESEEEGKGWIAYKGFNELCAYGKTPEEATASLWLALNTKP